MHNKKTRVIASCFTGALLPYCALAQTSGVIREYWTGVNGTSVSAIPVNTTPTGSDILPNLEATNWANPSQATNWAENYGQILTTYLTAPETGNYTFWIACDDNGELRLSTDQSAANASVIASVPTWTNRQEWDKFPSQKSTTVFLVAGQTYYLQALQKEAFGGDNLSIGWARPGQSTAAPSEVIPGNVLSTEAPAGISISTLSPAADAYVQGGSTAGNNFGSADILIVKDDPGNPRFTRQSFLRFNLSSLASQSVSRATLRLKVLTDDGNQGNQHTAAFVANDSWGETSITFNNQPATSGNLDTVSQVDDGEWIEFDVTSQVQTESGGDGLFSVQVSSNGTRRVDYFSRESANSADRPQLVVESGGGSTSGIAREYFTGIPGNSVDDIPLNATPTGSDVLPQLEATDWNNPSNDRNWADNYGQILTGYITAPETGDYTFWIASDDQSELYLSSNSLPDGSSLIASVPSFSSFRQWDKFSQQQSAPVSLEAGQTYFLQIYQKEGIGGDHLSVGWSRPGESTTTPAEIVPGSVLSTVPPAGSGLRRDYYTGVSGTGVANIPLGDPVTGTDVLTNFQAVDWNDPSRTRNWANNYGQVITGFITAPQTGAYTFWIASDDQGEFYLSSNESEDNAALIASVPQWTNQGEWDKFPEQKSNTVQLVAGRKYFVRVLHKEAGGGDNLAIGWARPGQSTTAPSEIIPGSVLSPPLDGENNGGSLPQFASDLNGNGIADVVELFGASSAPSVYADSDSDGLDDQLETLLGFDPGDSDSVRTLGNGGDRAQFLELITGANPNGGLFGSNTPGVPSEAQAGRFLSQAAFGPSPSEIASLRALGPNAYEKWIDQQMTQPRSEILIYLSLIESLLPQNTDFPSNDFFNPAVPYAARTRQPDAVVPNNYRTAALRFALFGPDQLRQRTTAALLKILVADPVGDLGARNIGRYRDILSEYAFGSYEDLLFEVSRSACMASYLSSIDNKKADPTLNRMPDENYAREIMQLFSIGLFELNMDGTQKLDQNGDEIPTYTNEDIVQVARVFTGLELNRSTGSNFWDFWQNHPLFLRESNHDRGDAVSQQVYGMREKRFLQSQFYTPPALPSFDDDPGRTGFDDIRDTCAILVNHPSCPPFVTKLLIQHLVTSNPSPQYVERVANVFVNDGNGNRGNLGAVVKAILLDPEARSLSSQFEADHGKLKGSMLRVTTLAKAFRAGINTPALYDLTGVQSVVPNVDGRGLLEDIGETIGEQFPSVFSFYLPEYRRPGAIADNNLVSPEFQILNSQRAVTMPNLFWLYTTRGFEIRTQGGAPPFRPNFAEVIARINNTGATIDYLNDLLCHGTMSAQTRDIIANALNQATGTTTQRAELAVYFVQTCPEAAILR